MLLSTRRGPTCPLMSSTSGPGTRPDPVTKKAAFPAACSTVQPQRRRTGQAAAVVFVRENHLYSRGGSAVSNLLTETSQLSPRDRAVQSLLEELASPRPPPPPSHSPSFFSRLSPFSAYPNPITLKRVYCKAFE